MLDLRRILKISWIIEFFQVVFIYFISVLKYSELYICNRIKQIVVTSHSVHILCQIVVKLPYGFNDACTLFWTEPSQIGNLILILWKIVNLKLNISLKYEISTLRPGAARPTAVQGASPRLWRVREQKNRFAFFCKTVGWPQRRVLDDISTTARTSCWGRSPLYREIVVSQGIELNRQGSKKVNWPTRKLLDTTISPIFSFLKISIFGSE